MIYDVAIVGGGPGGLSAALTLGRARKRVLVLDGGPRRNAAAKHMQNFVTRDGTPPSEFRAIGREQLRTYPNVEVRDGGARVESITGVRGAFNVDSSVEARRVLLSLGMIDEPPAIPGFRELWGETIFQCPYCHGWEVKDQRWGYLARPEHMSHVLPFVLKLRGWSRDVTVFTNGPAELPPDVLGKLETAKVRVVRNAIQKIERGRIELEGAPEAGIDVLFAHPPQRQVDLVRNPGLGLDDDGFVRLDPMTSETSIPGIYAAGDMTSRMQAAIFAASGAVRAATMINMELSMELALSGML